MITLLTILTVILLIANLTFPIIWPDKRLDRVNYTASGMAIAALIMLLMRG